MTINFGRVFRTALVAALLFGVPVHRGEGR